MEVKELLFRSQNILEDVELLDELYKQGNAQAFQVVFKSVIKKLHEINVDLDNVVKISENIKKISELSKKHK